MIIDDFFDYFRSCKSSSERTSIEYRKIIDFAHRWIKSNRHDTPDELSFYKSVSKQDLVSFLTFCDKELHNAPNTRCIKISAIRSFYQYLLEYDYISINPCASIPRPRKVPSPVRYLSLVESIVLIQSVHSDQRKFYNARNTCIVSLFLNCGFRLNELNSIKITDVDQGMVTVLGKGSKYRTLFLNPAARDSLLDYLSIRKSDSPYLFVSIKGKKLCDNAVACIVKTAIAKAGLDAKKYSTHKLRHTAATLMYRYGHTDVRVLQNVLGHTSINSTQIYTHPESIDYINAANGNPLSALNWH